MKRYFIWKDPAHAGEEDNWMEISCEEFCKMMKKPENWRRRFVFIPIDEEFEDEFHYEVSPEKYKEWNRDFMRELRKKDYKINHPIEFISLDLPMFDEEGCVTTLGNLLPSSDYADFLEQEKLNEQLAMLQKALSELAEKELEVINLLYLNNPEHKSERMIAEENGIPQKTLNCRKIKILKKIKKNFAQN